MLSPPQLSDNMSSSRSLALAAAAAAAAAVAAEQQYQKPEPHDQNRRNKCARYANQPSYSASLVVPARLSHASRAILPVGTIAAKTSRGNWVCKKCKRNFGRNIEQLSRTHVGDSRTAAPTQVRTCKDSSCCIR